MLHTLYHRARRFLPFLLKNILEVIKQIVLFFVAIIFAILFLINLYNLVSFIGDTIASTFPSFTTNERFLLGLLILGALIMAFVSIYMVVHWIIKASLEDYRRVYKAKEEDTLKTIETASSLDDTQEIKRRN